MTFVNANSKFEAPFLGVVQMAIAVNSKFEAPNSKKEWRIENGQLRIILASIRGGSSDLC